MILFIEDEPYFMAIYEEWLRRRFEVRHAGGADEALSIVRERPQDIELVILDIMMAPREELRDEEHNGGRKTGLRVFERIRGVIPGVPVVILTAVTRADVRKEGEAMGNCRYLHKPITPLQLDQAIKSLGVVEKAKPK